MEYKMDRKQASGTKSATPRDRYSSTGLTWMIIAGSVFWVGVAIGAAIL
jgi:hypothetical protein